MMASLSCFYINCSHPGAIIILMWQKGVILLNYRGDFTGLLQNPQTIRINVMALFELPFKVAAVKGKLIYTLR